MYVVAHGTWCNTRTFPINCKDCGEGIFFFSCDCGCRVLFEDLGAPWPIHNCLDDTPPPTPRPSDHDYFKNMQGVTLSVPGKDDGLLTGMTRFSGTIDPSVVQSVRQSESKTRDIMAVNPYSGGRNETPIGIVTHVSKISPEKRFNLPPNSLGARQVISALGSTTVTQITIHVDEIASDPDAEDLLSYTFWCNPKRMSNSLAVGNVVSASISPIELMGIGVKWLASSIEVLV